VPEFGPGLSYQDAGEGRPLVLLHGFMLVATPAEALTAVPTPTLVVIGAEDERAASGPDLAAALPHGSYAEIPGNHGTVAGSPELIAAMLAYLRPSTTSRAAS
jgi:hypothetical protein